ncbi:MAG: hypothetical protein AB7I32_01015 [Gammaproteobacteria bacterium]
MNPDDIETLIYAEGRLAYLGSEFEQDGNPMWAWEALHLWRSALATGLPDGTQLQLPPWVVVYLAEAAANMFALIDLPKGQRMAVPIQNALMLNKHSGRGSLIENWREKRAHVAREGRRTVAALRGDDHMLDVNKRRIEEHRAMPSEKHKDKLYVRDLHAGRVVDAEALAPHAERDRKRRSRAKK